MRKRFVAALAVAAASASASITPAASVGPGPVSIERLKTAYLWCSAAAARGELGAAEIMQCSVIYEELKRRAFGGDFSRFLDWSRAHPVAP